MPVTHLERRKIEAEVIRGLARQDGMGQSPDSDEAYLKVLSAS